MEESKQENTENLEYSSDIGVEENENEEMEYSSEGSGGETDSEDEILGVEKKKKKKKGAVELKEFFGGITSILGQEVKDDIKAPIMSKNKIAEKAILEEKERAKEKAEQTRLRREALEKDRVIPDGSKIGYEKRLRKTESNEAVWD
ncbi:hypothetical protein BB558_002147 [Smittium angustum]|uniref:Uncharacterized protein n=1 Tax=Smittium angustum TaxID=133377 RepID=A0A2U1J9F8_SMIAN|nr:hypothetical protein BB558_002147 [Smittium angustum]